MKASHVFSWGISLAWVFFVGTSNAASAARAEFTLGEVKARSSSGQERLLAKGSELESGDTVLTGSGSTIQLHFADGAMVSLRANSEFRIDNYQYAGQADGSERGFFSLLRGGLRTITGLIGKQHRQTYRVNAVVATIGIRGTEYSLQFSGGSDGLLEVATASGAIEVANGAGCRVVVAGGSATVSGASAPSGSGPGGGCEHGGEALPGAMRAPAREVLDGAATPLIPNPPTRLPVPSQALPTAGPTRGPN